MSQNQEMTRKQRRTMQRWEVETRASAKSEAQYLTQALGSRACLPRLANFNGVLLAKGEELWAEGWVRYAQSGDAQYRAWTVTNHRLLGQLTNGKLVGPGWGDVIAVRVNLVAGSECLNVDTSNLLFTLTGPGVAPLAVAAICATQGRASLATHPDLAPLRWAPVTNKLSRRVHPVAALGPGTPDPVLTKLHELRSEDGHPADFIDV
jgi:hypothetical protein